MTTKICLLAMKTSGKEVDRDRVRWWEVFGSFWWYRLSRHG